MHWPSSKGEAALAEEPPTPKTNEREYEMIRNLKALGLALVAVFALSAMAASSASADTFSAAAEPAFLTGSQGLEKEDEFVVTNGITRCSVVKYDGQQATSPTTSVTLTPTYETCKSLGLSAVVDTNGCDYLFTINDTTHLDTTGTIHIDCPTGQEITVTVAPPTAKCIIHVPEQTVPVTYANAANGDIKATVDYNGLTYSETKGTGLGACATGLNPSGGHLLHGGVYKGEGAVEGFSDAEHKTPTALSLIT
jgi:hypothetical protein